MDTAAIRKQFIRDCLALPDAYEDYPFDETWTVMRHRQNRKCFAFIYERTGNIWINLKCDPEWRDMWIGAHASIVPAYHMNKKHWISVILDGTVPPEVTQELLETSFAMTQ